MSVNFYFDGSDWDSDDEWVNMANSNAHALLHVLGFEMDPEEGLVGECEAGDMIARIHMCTAIGAHHEAVRPTVEVTVGTGARWVNFGIDADYVETRLGQLLTVAEHARDHNQMVVWN